MPFVAPRETDNPDPRGRIGTGDVNGRPKTCVTQLLDRKITVCFHDQSSLAGVASTSFIEVYQREGTQAFFHPTRQRHIKKSHRRASEFCGCHQLSLT